MKVQRVERHILKHNLKEIDELCFNSKNLYNYCNYILRQSFIQTGKLPKEYDLSKQLTDEKQVDWDKLHGNTNQQVLKLLYKNWKSFFKANREYKIHPEKFNGRPRLPKYKHKTKGRNVVKFTKCGCRIRNGYIFFNKDCHIQPIKTKITQDILAEARMVPQTNCYVLEIVYNKNVPDNKVYSENHLSIDLGINNFATCFNDTDNSSFIINGNIVKSINQYWNKKSSELKSILKKCSNQDYSKRLKKLTLKRNNKIDYYLHNMSKYIINYCVEHNIGTIIVGHNKEWKQDSDLGKINNQNFIQIPFSTFIDQLKYKCENIGLEFIETEERYSSKIDHYALEEMKHQEKYLGKRKHRGLFQSSKGFELNADVNGAIGILRKVVDDSLFQKIINRGLGENPIRIRVA